ncbi:MAG TPA: rhombosortase [bacterium]|nr:rhombosortase [bacterium]
MLTKTSCSSAMRLITTRYWGAWLLLGLWCITQYAGGTALWDYSRPAIQHGQFWRLLSGHFVHLNSAHLALNALGLLAILSVWGKALGEAGPLLLSGAIALGISLALWLNEPQLIHYAGASGVLHGLFAAGIVLAHDASPRFRLAAAAALLAKLVAETQFNTGSAELIGAPVIHAAHQWGAVFGTLFATAYAALLHRRRR